jgi:putative ABC transport system permease protein
VYIFSAIAVLMLLIASINFMNLSTAGASKRAKEVGIRKVLGSDRGALARQFFTEAILLAFIAVVLAVLLLWLALPLFNQLSGKNLYLDLNQVLKNIPLLVLFSIFVGLFAGSYPALYLSSFNPLVVLKNKLSGSRSKMGLRAGLVVFQFIISTGLIFCTLVVLRQLHFIQSKKLGYNKEQVLILPTWPLGKNAASFKNLIGQDNRVIHISGSGYIPAGDSFNNNFFIHTTDEPDKWIKTLRYDVDENYIPALDIQVQAGRNFSLDFGTDSLSAIVNETAARALGWQDNVLGKSMVNKDNKIYTVIGIVKDFHFKSLHESIAPLVMVLSPDTGNLIVKIKPGDVAGLLQTLEKHYQSFPAELPFSYSFLDDRFNNTYRTEQKTGNLLAIFAGLSILVACLGLFGLTLFTTNQRMKEISIRKVLGASEISIMGLLSYDFLKLVCLATIIACPIAWWIMSKWLQNFAYRTEIKAWMFLAAGSAAIIIALITVGTQAIRAAITNPIDSLRNE